MTLTLVSDSLAQHLLIITDMTTNSSALNIRNGGQVALAATAKKAGKRPTMAGLFELVSNISQQVKSAAKSNTVSFKKILEPAQVASGTTVATVKPPQEKKIKTTDPLSCVPVCPVSKQTHVTKTVEVSEQKPEAKTSPVVNHAGRTESPSQKSKPPNPNVRSTVDPRSPIHGQTLGNNDSGRTLITDGPKAKENAPAQKNTPIGQPPVELNTASSKNAKAARPSIDSNAVGDTASGKSTVSKFQTASVQPAVPPEAATAPASESKAKAPAAKGVAAATEKVRVHYQAAEIESNSKNITDKHIKPVQSQPEIAHRKQIQESAAAATAKIDTKVAAVSEQFSPLSISNTGVVNANASTTAASVTANAGATVHEQVASVAATASYKIGQKITVNLNPPELGRITIQFEKNGDELIGRVEVEKLQTKNQIDLNLSQIVQNLQDSGIHIKHFEVVLQEQPLGDQQEFTGHTQPDWNGKQQFGSEKNYSDIHSVLSVDDHFSYAAQNDAHFSDKSVNILA
jgi:flagellar hook-length control protein FliK